MLAEDRARRQYDAVEPENRLVAAELEARWNASLEALSEAERTLHDSKSAAQPFTEAEKQRLLQLGSQLPELWDDPQTPVVLKKRVLHTVIEEIICEVDDQASELEFRIHWAGGIHTVLRVPKNRSGKHGRMTDRTVIEVVRELASVSSDQAIAAILNRLGYETGAGNSWTEAQVKALRTSHDIAAMPIDGERVWLTLAESAAELKGLRWHTQKISREENPARQTGGAWRSLGDQTR